MSLASSRNTLRSDGGGGTPGETEKANPCACPGPWYGSCPTITTRTFSIGHALRASKIWDCGGYTTLPLWRSSSRKSARRANESDATASLRRASRHDTSRNPDHNCSAGVASGGISDVDGTSAADVDPPPSSSAPEDDGAGRWSPTTTFVSTASKDRRWSASCARDRQNRRLFAGLWLRSGSW